MKNVLISAVVIAVAVGFFISIFYAQQGPVEKAGSKIDQAIENTKDAFTPAGPLQKAGKQADQTIGTN